MTPLAVFRDGTQDPYLVPSALFGGQTMDVRDLAVTDRGLYVMTSSALYLIPEIR